MGDSRLGAGNIHGKSTIAFCSRKQSRYQNECVIAKGGGSHREGLPLAMDEKI